MILAFITVWGSILISLGLLATGMITRSVRLMLAGAIAALPCILYLAGSPLLNYWVAPVAASNSVAVYAMVKGYRKAAFVLLLPYAALILWAASILLSQPGL